MIYQLIYTSRVGRSVRYSDAESIAADSAARNERAGLTGLLLYTPSHFIQVLEGPEDAVRATLARIGRDPRHTALKIVSARRVERARFEKWAMRASMPRAELAPEALERLEAEDALRLLGDAVA